MSHDSSVTQFSDAKDHGKIQWGYPLWGQQMQVGWVNIGHFLQITRFNSKKVKDRHRLYQKQTATSICTKIL